MSHVFISYVRENQEEVGRLAAHDYHQSLFRFKSLHAVSGREEDEDL